MTDYRGQRTDTSLGWQWKNKTFTEKVLTVIAVELALLLLFILAAFLTPR